METKTLSFFQKLPFAKKVEKGSQFTRHWLRGNRRIRRSQPPKAKKGWACAIDARVTTQVLRHCDREEGMNFGTVAGKRVSGVVLGTSECELHVKRAGKTYAIDTTKKNNAIPMPG